MDTEKLKEKNILELIQDFQRRMTEDNPQKHTIDCIILSKLKTNQDFLVAYICSLGDSNLEDAAFMGIEDILKDMPDDKREALLSKVERLKEVLSHV